MTKWIERYRRQAEERYQRLDAVLAAMPDEPRPNPDHRPIDHRRPRPRPTGTPSPWRNPMSTTTNQTEIVVDPDVPLVRIIREFDAPPEKVFRAHVEPELVAQWLGPRRHEMVDRPLGLPHRRLLPLRAPQRRQRVRVPRVLPRGAPERAASCRPSPSRASPTRSPSRRSALEDLGDGRTRLVAQSLVDDFEARDAFVASGMEEGVREGYERLDALLAR